MNQEKRPLLAVVGPTASGKSRLSVLLAKKLGGEVVSCDSMQIYKQMEIGTAKPTAAEMDGVRHHLVDFADPMHPFSCADYVREAKPVLEEILSEGKLPIICGGTGLYLDRLLSGEGCMPATEPNAALRAELEELGARIGALGLHQRLSEVDPESAREIHPNNLPRVRRALEIYYTTGKPKSEWDRESRLVESDYRACVIGLRYEDRELLYGRINARVEEMLRAGLLEETERLMRAGVFEANATAAQAIGYKELLGYLRGEESLEDAVESLKRATRRYAKRQLTWFSAKESVRWITLDRGGVRRSEEELLAEALQIVKEDGAFGSFLS